ncbi:MAG: hypothetical protein EOP09_00225 [Proteobacteria bacterium]|nr:MAG: hypothetical protein EOP09_00225 [Pseudomonadota bacterium]
MSRGEKLSQIARKSLPSDRDLAAFKLFIAGYNFAEIATKDGRCQSQIRKVARRDKWIAAVGDQKLAAMKTIATEERKASEQYDALVKAVEDKRLLLDPLTGEWWRRYDVLTPASRFGILPDKLEATRQSVPRQDSETGLNRIDLFVRASLAPDELAYLNARGLRGDQLALPPPRALPLPEPSTIHNADSSDDPT